MEVKGFGDIVADDSDELRSILRRLSYVGVRGSEEYVSELFEHLAVHTLAKMQAEYTTREKFSKS